MKTREDEVWLAENKGKDVICPNSAEKCRVRTLFDTPCPHSVSHKGGQMYRMGICPFNFKHLECV